MRSVPTERFVGAVVTRLSSTFRRLSRHFEVGNFGVQLVSVAVSVPLSIVVARALGPEDRGVFALASLAAAVAAVVAGLGLSDAVPRVLARYPAPGVDGSLARLVLGAAAVVVVTFSISAPWWFPAIGIAAAPALIAGAALLTAAMAFFTFLANVGVAKGNTRLPIHGEAFRTAVYFVTCIVAIVGGVLTARTAVAALVLSYFLAGVFLFRRARPVFRRPPHAEEGAARREALGLGWRSAASWVLAYGSGRLDVLMIGAILGPAPAGLYAVATGIAELVSIPGTANGPAVLHRVAHARARGEPWGRALAGRVLSSSALSMAGAAVLAITAPYVVPVVLGAEFTGAIRPLQLLGVSTVALSSLRLLRQANFALGRTHWNWVGDLTAILVVIVGNLLLLRSGGLEVAAAIAIVANLCAVGVLALALCRDAGAVEGLPPAVP